MTRELMAQFRSLVCAMSPENVWCDGEVSAATARRTMARLRREWRALEKKAGRKVSESEVWGSVAA